MAVSPNTNFTAGQILTATQQNNFGRGIMAAVTPLTTTPVTFTTEATQITAPAFVAVANRYYKLTYFEPLLLGSVASTATLRIKNGATTIQSGNATLSVLGSATAGQVVCITTLAAGSTTLTATIQAGTGTGTATRSATSFAFLSIEDLGPA
jgi:hypothetical protein